MQEDEKGNRIVESMKEFSANKEDGLLMDFLYVYKDWKPVYFGGKYSMYEDWVEKGLVRERRVKQTRYAFVYLNASGLPEASAPYGTEEFRDRDSLMDNVNQPTISKFTYEIEE